MTRGGLLAAVKLILFGFGASFTVKLVPGFGGSFTVTLALAFEVLL